MTLNNPPDQPSVEQITNKNNFSYTSHAHHPLTGTPFSENNTAIPTTPATLTTLTTPASVPAANLASSPAIPTTPATPTTLATGDHSGSNFPLPLTILEHNTLTRLSPFAALRVSLHGPRDPSLPLSTTALSLTTALWQSSPTGVTSPFTIP